MFYGTKIIGNFEVSTMTLVHGHILHFTVKDPRPELHKHENSMVKSGGMVITTGEYSTTVVAGKSTKFTPRANTTPFEAGTVSTLTAVGPTQYVCVKELTGKTLTYDAHAVTGSMSLMSGTLVVPTTAYTLNGQPHGADELFVAAEGDVFNADGSVTIGIFTPT